MRRTTAYGHRSLHLRGSFPVVFLTRGRSGATTALLVVPSLRGDGGVDGTPPIPPRAELVAEEEAGGGGGGEGE